MAQALQRLQDWHYSTYLRPDATHDGGGSEDVLTMISMSVIQMHEVDEMCAKKDIAGALYLM